MVLPSRVPPLGPLSVLHGAPAPASQQLAERRTIDRAELDLCWPTSTRRTARSHGGPLRLSVSCLMPRSFRCPHDGGPVRNTGSCSFYGSAIVTVGGNDGKI